MIAVALLAISVSVYSGCGSSSSSSSQSVGALDGNWQFNLTQNYPLPAPTPQPSFSGFLQESNGSLSGSVQGPTLTGGNGPCGGIGTLSGTVNNQNVTFTLNQGGTEFNFTGSVSSSSSASSCSASTTPGTTTVISGTYQAPGGACYYYPTSGSFTACLVPPLNGNFTGTISSQYMAALNTSSGSSAVPVAVSGSFAQSANAGGSDATLTGTISAVGYPCFTTASLTGTISGQNIYLSVYDYNGVQIGTIGQIPSAGNATLGPATLMLTSTGLAVTNNSQFGGLAVNIGNPCPAIFNPVNGQTLTSDPEAGSDDFTLSIQ